MILTIISNLITDCINSAQERLHLYNSLWFFTAYSGLFRLFVTNGVSSPVESHSCHLSVNLVLVLRRLSVSTNTLYSSIHVVYLCSFRVAFAGDR